MKVPWKCRGSAVEVPLKYFLGVIEVQTANSQQPTANYSHRPSHANFPTIYRRLVQNWAF